MNPPKLEKPVLKAHPRMVIIGIVLIGLAILGGIGGYYVQQGFVKTQSEKWKDLGTIQSVKVDPKTWQHVFTMNTTSHGIIHSEDGPNGNMTSPWTFPLFGGCSSYIFGGKVGSLVGINYDPSCGYALELLN